MTRSLLFGTPALFVFFTVTATVAAQAFDADRGYYAQNGGGYYYSGTANPMAGMESSHIIVEEGTISYSMFDRKTGKLVWKGSAIKELNTKTNIEATIKKATAFIFARLPIKK